MYRCIDDWVLNQRVHIQKRRGEKGICKGAFCSFIIPKINWQLLIKDECS